MKKCLGTGLVKAPRSSQEFLLSMVKALPSAILRQKAISLQSLFSNYIIIVLDNKAIFMSDRAASYKVTDQDSIGLGSDTYMVPFI